MHSLLKVYKYGSQEIRLSKNLIQKMPEVILT